MFDILAAVFLIALTGPDNQQIEINPEQVVALRAPKASEKKSFPPGVQCLVYTTDSHFISVIQTCDQVSELLHQAK